MAGTPRRWRFQIHLSTAVVMMFVAGLLMWANFISGKRTVYTYGPEINQEGNIEYKTYGWPLSAIFDHKVDIEWFYNRQTPMLTPILEKKDQVIFIDALTALIILFAVWFVCERLIRRRAARKGA